jgi:hypothetical protein
MFAISLSIVKLDDFKVEKNPPPGEKKCNICGHQFTDMMGLPEHL